MNRTDYGREKPGGENGSGEFSYKILMFSLGDAFGENRPAFGLCLLSFVIAASNHRKLSSIDFQ